MKKSCFTIMIILCTVMIYAQNPEYPVITRLEGVGAGENFLELADGEYDKILGESNNGEVTYKSGAAPIRVKVFNPSFVKEGVYIITFVDPAPGDTLSLSTRWILLDESGDTLATANKAIGQENEQFIADLGIAVRIVQSDDAGDKHDMSNGTIGYSLTYDDTIKSPWLSFIPDDFGGVPYTNFIQTELHWYPDYLLDPHHAFSTFAPWVPFILTDTEQNEPAENPAGWNLTPGWMDPSGGLIQSSQFGGVLQSLNNVDIILTSDTSKWSRCVVVETGNNYYTDTLPPSIGLVTEGNKENLQPRAKPSVGKYDADLDGFPDPDGAKDENGNPMTGMGWFPGYAVDVETGERLNIFFGENSVYSGFVAEALEVGSIASDMIWNPGKQVVLPGTGSLTPLEVFAGGQQYVYVTRTRYDACRILRRDLDRTGIIKARALSGVTWCAIPVTNDGPDHNLLPLNDGLIPNDVTIKLRVDNPYQLETGNGLYNDYPAYRFKLEGTTSIGETEFADTSLMIYPNPATDNITIEMNSGMPDIEGIIIYNSAGRRMIRKAYQGQSKVELNVGPLAPGLYLIEIRTESGNETRKFMIQ